MSVQHSSTWGYGALKLEADLYVCVLNFPTKMLHKMFASLKSYFLDPRLFFGSKVDTSTAGCSQFVICTCV